MGDQSRVMHIVSAHISPGRAHRQDLGDFVRAAQALAQLVEHLTVDPCSNQMVPGSIPGGRIFAQPTQARTQTKPTAAPKKGTPGFEPGTC